MNSYIVTINYVNTNPASPLYRKVRTTNRKYTDVSGPAAIETARKNFTGSRNALVKIVSMDVHDEQGHYAY